MIDSKPNDWRGETPESFIRQLPLRRHLENIIEQAKDFLPEEQRNFLAKNLIQQLGDPAANWFFIDLNSPDLPPEWRKKEGVVFFDKQQSALGKLLGLLNDSVVKAGDETFIIKFIIRNGQVQIKPENIGYANEVHPEIDKNVLSLIERDILSQTQIDPSSSSYPKLDRQKSFVRNSDADESPALFREYRIVYTIDPIPDSWKQKKGEKEHILQPNRLTELVYSSQDISLYPEGEADEHDQYFLKVETRIQRAWPRMELVVSLVHEDKSLNSGTMTQNPDGSWEIT